MVGESASSSASSSNAIPRIMVFKPSLEEMKDFSKYIQHMENEGAYKAGLAKIIPPSEWCPRKSGYDNVDVMIKQPIQQLVQGSHGMYTQYNVQKRSMTAKEFKKLAEGTKYRTPQHFDYEELERKYWKNVSYNPPIYGADVPGTLTDSDCDEFNINKLNTILDLINESYGIKIMGVNTAYLYFGMWKTTFAWHTEDMDLYSINYLHFGAPKSWYCIPPEHGKRLERLAAGYFPNSHKTCPAFLRHKMTLMSPQMLKNNSIPFNKITQEPGEFMITFPYSYHAGYNHGYNCAESTNFALPRWVEFGKRATRCLCRSDSVKISMDVFVRTFQPDRYNLWLEGKDVGPDPKDPSHICAAPIPSSYELNVFGKPKRHPPHKKEFSEGSDTEEYDSDERSNTMGRSMALPTKAARKMFDSSQSYNLPETSSNEGPNFSADISNLTAANAKPPSLSETILRIQKNINTKATNAKVEKGKKRKHKATNDMPPHLSNHSYAKTNQNDSYPSFCTLPNHVGSVNTLLPFMTGFNETVSQCLEPHLTKTNTNCNTLPQASDKRIDRQFNKFIFSNYNTMGGQSNPSQPFPSHSSTSTSPSSSVSTPIKSEQSLDSSSVSMGECSFMDPPNIQPYYECGSSLSNHHESAHPPLLKPIDAQSIAPIKLEIPICSTDTSIVESESKSMIEVSTSTEDIDLKANSLVNRQCVTQGNMKFSEELFSGTLQYAPSCSGRSPMSGITEEIRFNICMSTIAPHCAICILLKPFKLHESLRTMSVDQWYPPKQSEILIPSAAFTSKVSDENTILESRDTSPLLVCMDCRVCVHAVCYGVSDLLYDGSERNWKCDRCSKHNYFASCILCPLMGGPLKEAINTQKNNNSPNQETATVNTKSSGPEKWVHLTCALLVPDVKFVNGITKKPVDISGLKKIWKNEKAGCIYCKKKHPDNKMTEYLIGYCIQCTNSASCTTCFHVTCGHRNGAVYKSGDWPYPITITCQRCAQTQQKRQIPNQNLSPVNIGTDIIAQHKNRRYYQATVTDVINQVFHHVHFVDNSFTELLKSSEFLSHDIEKNPPEVGDIVEVIFNKDQLSGLYSGNHICKIYTIQFDDGSQMKVKREEFYLQTDELPRKVQNKLSTATVMKHLLTNDDNGSRKKMSI